LSTHLVTLCHGDIRVVIDPVHGGAVREFSEGGEHLFRPTPHEAEHDPFSMSCFPMVPYANRIADGRFRFLGRDVQLAPNRAGERHPLHGDGWCTTWSEREVSASTATLLFDGGGDAWPWVYRCEQVFVLKHDSLQIALTLQNLASAPMPAMLGLHPYFPDVGEANLTAHLPRVWLTRNDLAVKMVPTPHAWQFDGSQPLRGLSLDNSFCGWPGTAQLTWRNRRLCVSATNCGHLHIYIPVGRDHFCIEPQTAPAGSLNRGGVRPEFSILEPGDRLTIQVDFSVG
jgi:aldose 1-epimerase